MEQDRPKMMLLNMKTDVGRSFWTRNITGMPIRQKLNDTAKALLMLSDSANLYSVETTRKVSRLIHSMKSPVEIGRMELTLDGYGEPDSSDALLEP